MRFRPRGSPLGFFLRGAIGLGTIAAVVSLGADVASASPMTAVYAIGGVSSKMEVVTELVTHIIAFGLFVLILYKTLWPKILQTIDDRRDKIEADFNRAEELQQQADESRKKYEAQLKEMDAKAREEMQKAIDEGKRIAAEIQAKAREEAEAILERAKQNTEIELANARKQLRKDVVELTLQATERVLREQVDKAAHQKYIDRYIDELGGLQ